MNKKLIWAIPLLLTVFGALYFIFNDKKNKPEYIPLTIGASTLKVEVAKTFEERNRGLCCRDHLPQNQGMLFVYDRPGDYGFWMKDTLIPLDMYWIDGKKQIVHIKHSVQPDSYPKTYKSPKPAQYVLETNSGYAKKHNIDVGERVKFNF